MDNIAVRTRYAPSPTGFMHIGNLRTALYEYLIAKSYNGSFILRLEDTDRDRYVEGAEQAIYNALNAAGLKHDEGPDIGGPFEPYVQSLRKDTYLPYAEQLVKQGKAYYCFCGKQRLEGLNKSDKTPDFSGYDRKCRDMNPDEVKKLIKSGAPYVIRQKMPINGSTIFNDAVFGKVTVENSELEDQILIKTDGYPTYNFANVVDDHSMNITHVVRGCEYLSSTPKYNLLYEAFGWKIPVYIHLPLIMGKALDGSVSKLSKRHGAVGFEELIKMGYLPEAVINYIAFLGWCPEGTKEIFTLEELIKEFSYKRISKSPAIFDYSKLDWFNGEYIKSKSLEEFEKLAEPYIKQVIGDKTPKWQKVASVLKQRLSRLSEIPSMIDFINCPDEYNNDMFVNKKSKSTAESSLKVLIKVKDTLKGVEDWTYENIHDTLILVAKEMELKNGTVMWPVRIAISGRAATPGGAVEILDILGKGESLNRIKAGINKLKES